jgi:hypothetical protein
MPWTDQPAEIADATLFGSFSIETHNSKSAAVELHTKLSGLVDPPMWWYVTVGSLFGSQTLRCKRAGDVLEVLCFLGKSDFEQGATSVVLIAPSTVKSFG